MPKVSMFSLKLVRYCLVLLEGTANAGSMCSPCSWSQLGKVRKDTGQAGKRPRTPSESPWVGPCPDERAPTRSKEKLEISEASSSSGTLHVCPLMPLVLRLAGT